MPGSNFSIGMIGLAWFSEGLFHPLLFLTSSAHILSACIIIQVILAWLIYMLPESLDWGSYWHWFNSFSPSHFWSFFVQLWFLLKKNTVNANPTHLVPLESIWSWLQTGIKKHIISYPWNAWQCFEICNFGGLWRIGRPLLPPKPSQYCMESNKKQF